MANHLFTLLQPVGNKPFISNNERLFFKNADNEI